MKQLLLIIFIFSSNIAIEPDLFDTHFLTNASLVRDFLIEDEHFYPVQFNSPDNIQLAGLWKEDSDAPFNIIFCAGFYPGRKEGMATFIRLVPESSNILFFDARGHGQSQGRFFSRLYRYGLDEYKDIIAAIEFVRTNNTKPIIIIGLCAGGFHTARALIALSKENKLKTLGIVGFVFDSGLCSLLNALHVPKHHFSKSIIPWFFKNNFYYDEPKDKVMQYKIVKVTAWLCSKLLYGLTLLHKPFFIYNDKKTAFCSEFHTISCPIFFIHSSDDTYCPINNTKNLAALAQQEQHWWIEKPSKHASHHLKFADEYRMRLVDFFSKLVNT